MNEKQIKSIMSAVYLTIGQKEYSLAFTDKEFNFFISEHDAYASLSEAVNLSNNQKTALFSYIYLYCKLLDKESKTMQSALGISNGIVKNIDIIVTSERLEYIKKYYKKQNQGFAQLFVEPEEFIVGLVNDIVSAKVQEDKKRIRNLNSDEYEHPLDKSALSALKSETGLSQLVKFFNEYAVEKVQIVGLTGSYFQVTEKNLPYVFNALQEACRILDVQNIPKFYIQDGPINAYTTGTKDTVLVLCSACLSLLEYDELLFILGHELGHIKSKHVLYHSMADYALDFGDWLVGGVLRSVTFGISDAIMNGLQIALMEWKRKSELTADRAGLLACQNQDAAFSTLTKMAGFPMKYYSAINTDDLLAQAQTFEGLDSFSQIAKTKMILSKSHPWIVLRAKELKQWIDSGAYKRIIENKSHFVLNEGSPSNGIVKFK